MRGASGTSQNVGSNLSAPKLVATLQDVSVPTFQLLIPSYQSITVYISLYQSCSLVPRLSPLVNKSDGKLGGAWERGYQSCIVYLLLIQLTKVHGLKCSALLLPFLCYAKLKRSLNPIKI